MPPPDRTGFRYVPGSKFYVASKTRRAPIWQTYRSAGAPIISSWIDEAGPGQTGSMEELWLRIFSEIRQSSYIVFLAPVDDYPWKGASVECGAALFSGRPVLAVTPGMSEIDRRTLIGSWINHPSVTFYENLDCIFGLNCGY